MLNRLGFGSSEKQLIPALYINGHADIDIDITHFISSWPFVGFTKATMRNVPEGGRKHDPRHRRS